ncbi:MAG: hypothetical protein LBJ44_08050 [Propionibacteriaceae bacterium]|jgi:hypothetical protein|nr:hypothetical protein [Propionibacteriaceae bacterium]
MELGVESSPAGSRPPAVNTHVHLPPNFSAFANLGQAVEAARHQGLLALGISNFYDQRVYAEFGRLARANGLTPLFGLEFITLASDLAAAGIRVNDPANPGRMYFCGKGIDPARPLSDRAQATAEQIRRGNDQRAERMVERLSDHLSGAGLDCAWSAQTIAAQVAERAQVPLEWVSLQERHIALALQQALSELDRPRRAAVLERAYGGPSQVDLDDPVALQGELRARLMKASTPGFVAEVPLDFEAAFDYVLDRGGIPCYPTLADGVDPVCPFEASPERLAQALVDRGVWAAELIPLRNRRAVVDRYVEAFQAAGLIVMAGTEHNTADRVPLDPFCLDGPVSAQSRQAFYEATCLVAAHAARTSQGQPGYVDGQGRLIARGSERSRLVEQGRAILEAQEEPCPTR